MTSSNENLSPQEYYTLHQKAFRCAFDFLNSHFPPGEDPEWWEGATKDLEIASISQKENTLAVELLTGVWFYLEKEMKRRKELETDH